jgi:hypothetical protein
VRRWVRAGHSRCRESFGFALDSIEKSMQNGRQRFHPRPQSAMSDHAASTAHAPEASPSEPLFDRDELHQFEEDDREAGTNIGKMLSMLFVYTVIVMSISAYATYAHWMGR